ncbi:MAG: DeoR family transcriptional regulator [Anaerolineales bacterium]|nr:DeoR family transcriptional regulator [Anaerolineales bacterium]MCB8953772.1 DeoR family transcriptional regulator [Ardenticatenales bacterium]
MKFVTGNRKQNTRDTILEALKATPQATVEELAEAADVSPVTVRHHLNSLQAEGLLEATSVRRKIGRPHYVYSLSQAGHELFPKKYVRLSSRLLDELKQRFSDAVVADLFGSVVQKIINEHKGEFERLAFEKRLDYLVALLEEEGFLARWEKADGKYRLTEYSCPYISVGQSHTEVCTLDKELVVQVLQTEIEQHSCMLMGDPCCQFSFTNPDTATAKR